MITPEQSAALSLRKIGWDDALPIDPVPIANCYGIEVMRDLNLAGSTTSGCNVIADTGGKAIIVNAEDSLARKRFTIAHELGRALLDDAGELPPDDNNLALSNYRNTEAKLNRFATALLMPENSVRDAHLLGKDLEEMARRFGLPQTTMRIRLTRLGIL